MLSALSIGYVTPGPKEFQVHPERAKAIEEVNKAGTTWKAAAHPRFAGDAPGASANLLGVKGNWQVDISEAIKTGDMEEFKPTWSANAEIPEAWDAAEAFPECAKAIGDIRDQSNCGCCWAFGGTSAATDRMCISSKAEMLFPLSAQDICFNSNFNGCGGGQISTPWSYIKRTGVVSGGQNKGIGGPFGDGFCSAFSLPHCHHHGPKKADDPYPSEGEAGCPSESSPRGPKACDSDAKSPHGSFSADKVTYSGVTQTARGETAIKQCRMEGGTCEVAFTVYSDFEDYATGIYQHVSGGSVGGHAVKFVGWGTESGTKYWKVANSWNKYWGEDGYFRIGMGEGGIDAECVASPASATYSKK
jgi:cathepsin B